ncbi:MAG: hypothetical protein AB1545_01685 [Thermodesulfobacteriota bacterium]|jgi:hypothetical protein
MLVFCEECGKRYSFPPEECEAGSGQFRCRACGFLMSITLPVPVARQEGAGGLPPQPADPAGDGGPAKTAKDIV